MPILAEKQFENLWKHPTMGTPGTGNYADCRYWFLAGAAAEREAVLAIVKEESNRPFTLSNTPQNQGYMEGCSDTCDEITRRIRQRGEEGE